MSALNTSAGMLPGPAALLFFRHSITLSTSVLVGGSQFLVAGGSIGGSIGRGSK